MHSAGFAENVKYLLQKATERKNIGNKDTGYKSTGKVELTAMVCGILPGEDPAEVISQLRTAVTAEDVKTSEEWQFTAVPSPLLCPERGDTARGGCGDPGGTCRPPCGKTARSSPGISGSTGLHHRRSTSVECG